MPDVDARYRELFEKTARATSDEAPDAIEELHARYVELADVGTFAANTPGGLPYPVPTDPLTAGADAIRALAEAIETKYRRTLAETFVPLRVLKNVLTNELTVTATTTTAPVILSGGAILTNAGSGANRSADAEVTQDGVLFSGSGPFSFDLPMGTGGNRGLGFSFQYRIVPTAGSHTWALRFAAPTASCQMQGAYLILQTQGA